MNSKMDVIFGEAASRYEGSKIGREIIIYFALAMNMDQIPTVEQVKGAAKIADKANELSLEEYSKKMKELFPRGEHGE